MQCFTVVDDCVIAREFRGRFGSDDTFKAKVLKCVPDAKILVASDAYDGTYADLYTACCELTAIAEDTEPMDWFVGLNTQIAEALAILHVISVKSLWSILQDKDTFNTWVTRNVR